MGRDFIADAEAASQLSGRERPCCFSCLIVYKPGIQGAISTLHPVECLVNNAASRADLDSVALHLGNTHLLSLCHC